MRTVTVFTRAGCHLCDDALTVIAHVRERVPFVLDVRDIEDDEELLMRYLERIPVVTVDGTEMFEFFVDGDALAEAVGRTTVL